MDGRRDILPNSEKRGAIYPYMVPILLSVNDDSKDTYNEEAFDIHGSFINIKRTLP